MRLARATDSFGGTTGDSACTAEVVLFGGSQSPRQYGLCTFRLQGPGPSTPEELLSHVAVHRPSNVYQLLALLDTLEVALGAAEAAATWQQQQQQQQQDGMQGLEGAGATAAGAQGHMPGGPAGAAAAPRDRRRVPHLLVVDSVSALLSTVVGSSQHTQGGRARDTGTMENGLSSWICTVSVPYTHAADAGFAYAELFHAVRHCCARARSQPATHVLVLPQQAARC